MGLVSPAPTPLETHHRELARAAGAAMQRQYPEAIEICSELLTGPTYAALATTDPAAARRARAEARLLLASAMHYDEAHEEDLLRVLNAALDSPDEVRKDVLFTLALVRLSFDHLAEARDAILDCLEIVARLRAEGAASPELDEKQAEANQLLQVIAGRS